MDRRTTLKNKQRAREQRELSLRNSSFPSRYGGMTKREQRSIMLSQVRADFDKYDIAYRIDIHFNDQGKLVVQLEER